MNEAKQQIRNLNAILQQSLDAGDTATMSFEGRPPIQVDSLDPLVYHRLSMFSRPQLVGVFAVYGLFALDSYLPNRIVPWLVIGQTRDTMYGAPIYNPSIVNQIGQKLTGNAAYNGFY